MFVENIKTEGLAHLSCMIGDGKEAAVLDPRRDVEVYLEMAVKKGSRITCIFETRRGGSPPVSERHNCRGRALP